MRAGTQTGIGTAPLSAVPRGAREIARSDLAQAAQVDALRNRKGRATRFARPGTGPITEAQGEVLRCALARCGTVRAAGEALGWPDGRAGRVALQFGIRAEEAALQRALTAPRAAPIVVPHAILERTADWLRVYRRHGGNANIYRATKAADAAMIAALEALL